MGAAEVHDDIELETPDGGGTSGESLALAPDVVEVRRNAALAAFVGAVAFGIGIAYLARAASTGAVLDWALAAVMGLVGVGHLVALVDARTPLLVADTQGMRIRLGRSWRGLPWGALSPWSTGHGGACSETDEWSPWCGTPPAWMRELDRGGRRRVPALTAALRITVRRPPRTSTRVRGAGEDLTAALTALAAARASIVEIEDEPRSAGACPGATAAAARARHRDPGRAEPTTQGRRRGT